MKDAINEVLEQAPRPSVVVPELSHPRPEHEHRDHHHGAATESISRWSMSSSGSVTEQLPHGHEQPVPGFLPLHGHTNHEQASTVADDYHEHSSSAGMAQHRGPGPKHPHGHARGHSAILGGAEGSRILDFHGHAEIPILSGAGNFLIGVEKRSLATSGKDDEHVEFGIEGPRLYAGIRPGAELQVSDHGQEYAITLRKATKDWGLTGKFHLAGGEQDVPSSEQHEENAEQEGDEHHDEMPTEIHGPHTPLFDRLEFEATTKYGRAGLHAGKIYVAPEVTMERMRLGGIFQTDPKGQHHSAILRITLE